MQGQDVESVQSSGGNRVLRFGTVRVHNGHLQNGITTTPGCPVCSEGLESALAPVAPRAKDPEVVEGDGGDEEDDPALAYRRGADSG